MEEFVLSSDDRNLMQELIRAFGAFIDLLREPVWLAEAMLVQQNMAHTLTVLTAMDEEFDAVLHEAPRDDAGWAVVASYLEQESDVRDVVEKRGLHEPLQRLVKMLRKRCPEIHKEAAQVILAEWLLQGKIPEASYLLGSAPHRGRPAKLKQDSAEPKTQKRQRIDPNLAARAYDLHSDGRHWTTIAKELVPTLNLYDEQQRQQARSRVNRLIERGRLNSR